MLANGIKQTTSTTGTGALTLSAVAGWPTFSAAFGLNRPLAYTLLDASGLFLEAGIGYLSGASTLVRAKVTATYSGGVYNDSNPTAINLSGTTTVLATPHAATLESVLPGIDPAAPNRYLTSAHRNNATTAAGPSTGLAYYMPHLHRCAARITALAVNVTTQVAGATAQIGLYACGENGQPGALIAKSTDLDMSVLGLRTYSLPTPLFLPPGWYYTAYVGSSGSLRLTGYTGNVSNVIGPTPLGLNASLVPIDSRTESLSEVSLPTTPAPTGTSNGAMAIVYLGVE
ncbi:hypothetical protein [Massilia sp. DD77]|uniref:hypothetical protein n=1 Tax=Massilia sp. DD77 TaxID=3109349 RepID=UPI002FFFDE44